MKILFLDIDGVLNNIASLAEGVHIISDKCVMLRECLKDVDAQIVVSSSWRILYDVEMLRQILRRSGLNNPIIDVTPKVNGCRGLEIYQWLSENEQVTKYCIVDDDSDMLDEQLDFFVKCDTKVGLTSREIREIKEILKD
jgi:hypothetical protein